MKSRFIKLVLPCVVISFAVMQRAGAQAPTITNQPVSLSVIVGNSATFSVGVGGNAPLSYQWQFNQNNLLDDVHYSGSLSATLNVANAQFVNGGNYSVIISNNYGSVTSQLATLTIASLPGALTLYDTNLIIVRVGDGAQTLATTGNSVFLDQFTTSGGYVNTLGLPSGGPMGVVMSGGSFVEGYLSRSLDRSLICFAAYGTNLNSGSVLDSATSVPRVVVTFDAASTFNQPVSNASDFAGVAWRSAATDGTNNFWGAAAAGGTVYLGNNAPHVLVQSTKPNDRVVELFNGNLYMSSASTVGDGVTGIYKFNGLPKTTVGLPATLVSTNTFTSPNGVTDFAVNPAETTIYFADDRTPGGIVGGIQRWDFDALHNVWVNSYHLTNGIGAFGASHLEVDWSGPNPVLYATTSETSQNRLVKVIDSGSASSFTLLATAGTNQLFRGVKFGPVATLPFIATQPQSRTNLIGTTATFSVAAGGTGPFSSQWQFNGTNLTDNLHVSGSQGTSLAIANVQTNDAGNFRVVVTADSISLTSSVAQLTILTIPAFTTYTNSTAVGYGADVELREFISATEMDDATPGDRDQVNVRFSPSGPRNEVIALRFDLRGFVTEDIRNAHLELVNYRDDPSSWTLHCYGLKAGAVGLDNNTNAYYYTNGPSPHYTENNWDESAAGSDPTNLLRFSTMPGLEYDNNFNTPGFRTNDLVDLGSQLIGPKVKGQRTVLNNPALMSQLTSFINSHPDRLVTILIGRDDNTSTLGRFASKEAIALDQGSPTGAAGDFAPRLVFDLNQTGSSNAVFVYNQDFEGVVGSEWNNTSVSVTPLGGRRFLGEFGNQTVQLSVGSLPAHNLMRVSFDLFVLRSWDGNLTPNGPDIFQLVRSDGTQFFRTTFNNHYPALAAVGGILPVVPTTIDAGQTFPATFASLTSAPTYPPVTGAAEVNTLGYTFNFPPVVAMDSVYHLSRVVKHTATSVTLNFSASGLQATTDESWGLDNVRMELFNQTQGSLQSLAFLTEPPTLLAGNPVVFETALIGTLTNGVTLELSHVSDVAYTSGDTNVFTVNPVGQISPRNGGTASLVATYLGLSATTSVTVLAPIALRQNPPASLNAGGVPSTVSLFADFPGFTNQNVTGFGTITRQSSDSSIATFAAGGVLTPRQPGNSTLTTIYGGLTNQFSLSVVMPLGFIPGRLAYRYSFSEPSNSLTVVDSVGGADGQVINLSLGASTNNFTGTGQLRLAGGAGGSATAAYVNLPNGLVSGRQSVSFEGWVTWNGPATSTWQRLFDFGRNTAVNVFGDFIEDQFASTGVGYLYLTPRASSALPRFGIKQSTGFETPDLDGTAAFPVGSATHFAVVYDQPSGVARLYINGQRVATAAATFPLSVIEDRNVWLGRSQFSADPFLSGLFDEFRIYNGALLDSDVAASYAAGPNNFIGQIAPQPNDQFQDGTSISGAVVSTFGSTVGATKDPGEPDHAGNPGGHSVWWNWTATTNSVVTVDTIGSSFNTLLAVYTGNIVSNLVVVASDDDGGTNQTSRLTFYALAGTEYHIAVDGYGGAVGGIVLNLQASVPPQIVAQPKSRTISAGYASVVNFGVSALGVGPLTYQWWKDGSPIPLATNATLSVTSVSATNNFPSNNTNAGLYTVAVGNALGFTASFDAALSVEAYVVTRWAGVTASPGDTDGPWDTAQFREPDAIAVDAIGNLYVADAVSHVIRKITPDRVVSTLAGLAGTPGSADGAGSSARFNQPDRLAVDNAGYVYVSDHGNQTIRKITPDGVVGTLAGLAGNVGSADGSGSNARFNGPEGIAVDSAGNVYVGDLGNRLVRKITPAGVVTTLAGLAGASGSGDGQGSNARFVFPNGVAVDGMGNVYVADGQGGHTIRKITPAGLVTTLAGLGGSSGTADGTGSNARFTNPDSLVVDGAGNVYVAEFGGHKIRKITPDGFVTTLAGLGTASGSADGMGVKARFLNPNGVAVDSAGNLYVADRGNRTIRKVEPSAGILIQQQPVSVMKSENGKVDLSVQATGRGPFAYQWYFNGSPISGATQAVLHLANLTFAQSGSYQVRIQTSDGFETTWSDPVTLVVTPYLTWTGAVSSDWNNPTNWNPNKVPSASDRVVINSGSVVIPVNGVFDIMDWTGGNISGSLTISNSSVLNINGNVNLQCPLTNAGTVNWLSGGIQISNYPVGSEFPVVNLLGGLWNIQCDQSLYKSYVYVNTAFQNAGTIQKSANTGTTSINIPFANTANVQANAGTLTFNGGLLLSSSSVLSFPIGGSVPGAGYGRLATAGTIDLDGRLEVSLSNGFVPNVGDGFHLLAWGAYTNGFAQENGLDLGDGLYFQAYIAGSGLGLLVAASGATTPALATNLMDQVQAVGNTATFAFSPPGVGPFIYQWQFNGTNLPGENNASLVRSNVQSSDVGTYCVVVVDALLVTNVYCATLDALIAPSIAVAPASQTALIGSMVTFSVLADGTGPFAYQWRLNGASLPGATNNTYSITNVQPTDVGRYSVVVQNEAGAVASPDAELKVISPGLPFADDFDVAGSINGFGGVGSGNNTNATREAGEPTPAGKLGNRSVWLRWAAPADGVVTFDTRGSSFDTLLGVYTGTIVDQLNPMASDDDSGGFFTSSLRLNVQAGTNYNIAVEGLDDASGDIVLSWNLNTNIPPVPKILQQPADLTVPLGWPATFFVVADSTANLTYQWLFNKTPVPGATNDLLTLWNVSAGNVGFYRVAVRSSDGQLVTSLAASLEIGTDALGHSYDKLEDLLDSLGGGSGPNPHFKGSSAFPSVSVGTIGSQIINNFNSTTQQGEPVHSSVIGGSSRWYLLTATTNATMEIDTLGSDIATILAVYVGKDIFSLRVVATNVNGAVDGVHSMVMFPATNGTAYLVAVDGVKGAQGNIYVNWRMGIAPNPVGPPQMLALVNGAGLSLQSGVTNNVTAPTYQWQVNGVNIAGATNAGFTLLSLRFDQVGSYGVVVNNLLGRVVNPIATVSAQTPLTLAPGSNGFQLSGSATQAVVVQLSTNLTLWTPVLTNPTPLRPIIYSDPVKHPKAFYSTKPWP